MIRQETPDHWVLITHPDHARLAGEFADAWGNARFAAPDPYPNVRYAVRRHDDGWLSRDAAPSLTPAGVPEGFTRALVGAYSAFEQIDLPSYLEVRGRATEAVAAEDAYAALLVSMHTCNLLSEQADLASIRPEHREAHARFLEGQRAWQRETAGRLGAVEGELRRGFEFLQCCDNLSLIACSGYDRPRVLRHPQPDRDGVRHEILCTPMGPGAYVLDPWPLREDRITLVVPSRRVAKRDCANLDSFRAAFAAAPVENRPVTLSRMSNIR